MRGSGPAGWKTQTKGQPLGWPAASRWGNARMCSTTACWTPSTGSSRSQGLSVLIRMAIAHSITARMRWRTGRAVVAFTCRMGVRISSTSALVTSETGIRPMRGKA